MLHDNVQYAHWLCKRLQPVREANKSHVRDVNKNSKITLKKNCEVKFRSAGNFRATLAFDRHKLIRNPHCSCTAAIIK